jgi:dUTP pyrophosphatase
MEVPVFKFALAEGLDNSFLPTKGEQLSSGFDVSARIDITLKPGDYFKIPLGFRSFCPDGWYYQLHPRSSSFTKKYMHNLIGIIDESWEGETLFAGQYLPNDYDVLYIKYGDKIGQIIPCKRYEVIFTEISNKEIDDLFNKRNASRKSGGFGSTG